MNELILNTADYLGGQIDKVNMLASMAGWGPVIVAAVLFTLGYMSVSYACDRAEQGVKRVAVRAYRSMKARV